MNLESAACVFGSKFDSKSLVFFRLKLLFSLVIKLHVMVKVEVS